MVLEAKLSRLFKSDIEAEANTGIATVTLTAVDVVVTQSPAISAAVTGAVSGNTSGPFFEVLHNELTRSDLTGLTRAAANGIGARPRVGRASKAANGVDRRTIETSIASSLKTSRELQCYKSTCLLYVPQSTLYSVGGSATAPSARSSQILG